jgi:hypothetical protein
VDNRLSAENAKAKFAEGLAGHLKILFGTLDY